MDLSHMIGLWLVGQSPGVAPGGVGVVYAPLAASLRDAGPVSRSDAAGVHGVYPFSAGGWSLGGANPRRGGSHGSPTSRGLGWSAGVALIGELEYGPEGLDGFVPRLWSAVGVLGGAGKRVSAGPSSPRREAGVGEAEDAGADAHSRPAASCVAPGGEASIGATLNRGAGSIGLSDQLQFVDRFDAEGVLGRARVVGFVQRKAHRQDACATLVQTCEDVAAAEFPVMFEQLSAYLRFQVSAQAAGNGYDDLAGALVKSDRPSHAVVMVGFAGADPHLRGAQVRLGAGDVCHSVVYDSAVVTREAIGDALRSGETAVLEQDGVSWLRQEVV